MASLPLIYLTVGEVVGMYRGVLLRAGQPMLPIRDQGLLASAVQRPRNAAFYEGADLIEQAALYMVGIALNHPFADGNKRTGFVAGMAFLAVNGYLSERMDLDRIEFGLWLEQVVMHELTFEQFVTLLRGQLATPESRST